MLRQANLLQGFAAKVQQSQIEGDTVSPEPILSAC
jgi:hypothetical protein